MLQYLVVMLETRWKRLERQNTKGWWQKLWIEWIEEFGTFLVVFSNYLKQRISGYFGSFEAGKGVLVGGMYRQRGKYAGIFVHVGMVMLVFFGLTLGPAILSGSDATQKQWTQRVFGESATEVASLPLGNDEESRGVGGVILGTNIGINTQTEESNKPRSEVVDYEVQTGDTLSSIAEKFGVSTDTIRWENEDKVVSVNSIKPGQTLKIPPITGVVHMVKSGETIYSIAKKYDTDAQSMVDFPFNIFTNDETFALAIGQTLYVPDGVKTEVTWSPASSIARVLTPDAGAVSATGTWIWPAAGRITQPWRPWHTAIDIANKAGGSILAADSGRVVVAGWPDNFGYGNRVVIDHGNGFRTLYAHLSKFNVVAGQSVKRGDVLGAMGSTGRSTGTHLHFEIRQTGVGLNPLSFLK